MEATDTAALAANDDTHTRSVGEMVADAQPSPQPEPGIEVKVDGPTQREQDLERENNRLRERLRAFEERRDKEKQLLADRDAAIMSIESAKNRVAAEKKELSEIEAEIAALLKEPIPEAWEKTPIGQACTGQAPAIDAAKPEAPPPWADLLPAVDAASVHLIDGANQDLPTIDQLCGALIAPSLMESEKRVLKAGQTVEAFGRHHLVSALWRDEASGACRAHAIPLFSKEEWQNQHEEKFGRPVPTFDQTEEAKAQRKAGGEWCSLIVKVGKGKKTAVVGPQSAAIHIAYAPPEAQAPQPIQAEEDLLADASQPAPSTDEPDWNRMAGVANEAITKKGMTPHGYALAHDLPSMAFVAFVTHGTRPESEDDARRILDAFEEFIVEDDEDETVNGDA